MGWGFWEELAESPSSLCRGSRLVKSGFPELPHLSRVDKFV